MPWSRRCGVGTISGRSSYRDPKRGDWRSNIQTTHRHAFSQRIVVTGRLDTDWVGHDGLTAVERSGGGKDRTGGKDM